jgi:uncharacterized protein YlzI (FlbEa/FlbD family)
MSSTGSDRHVAPSIAENSLFYKNLQLNLPPVVTSTMETNFVEFTDKNGRPAMVNVSNITSIVVYNNPDEEVHIYVIGDKESYVTVKESYEEVKKKIAMVSGGAVW